MLKVTTMEEYLKRKQDKENGTIEAVVVDAEKEALYLELDELGIKYTKNMKTETLRRLLEDN
jgi:hypothetical protein